MPQVAASMKEWNRKTPDEVDKAREGDEAANARRFQAHASHNSHRHGTKTAHGFASAEQLKIEENTTQAYQRDQASMKKVGNFPSKMQVALLLTLASVPCFTMWRLVRKNASSN